MIDLRAINAAVEIASRVYDDPSRLAEMRRYHAVIIDALNQEHHYFEQDATCVFEAIAMVLGQLTGGLPEDKRTGVLRYVHARAEILGHQFLEAGKVARHG